MPKPALFLLAVLCLAATSPARQNYGGASGSAGPYQPPPSDLGANASPDPSAMTPAMLDHIKKMREAQYKKDLQSQCDQLLAVAQELQKSAAKADPAVLSFDFVKKAQQAEDLAHKIRATMEAGVH